MPVAFFMLLSPADHFIFLATYPDSLGEAG